MGIENYWGFVLAAVLLNLTPGADTVYILSRTLQQGHGAGAASALGISSGILVHAAAVALGLAHLLAQSPAMFAVLKYAGAAYLLWLGVQMWRGGGLNAETAGQAPQSAWRIYRQGVMTNVLNPKIALFFLALLPQFVAPHAAGQALPYLALGGTFALTSTVWCLLLVWLADVFKRRLLANPTAAGRLNKVCGAMLVGLGAKVALSR